MLTNVTKTIQTLEFCVKICVFAIIKLLPVFIFTEQKLLVFQRHFCLHKFPARKQHVFSIYRDRYSLHELSIV